MKRLLCGLVCVYALIVGEFVRRVLLDRRDERRRRRSVARGQIHAAIDVVDVVFPLDEGRGYVLPHARLGVNTRQFTITNEVS